jgi:glutaredoxin-like protein
VYIVENEIRVYGTWWCGDCRRVRHYFDRNQIRYSWVDIDKDQSGEAFVIDTNHGMRSVPTIVFSDGSILVEPSERELEQWFGSRSG